MLGNDSLALEVQEVNYCGLLDQISLWKTFHDSGTFGFLFPFVFTLFFSQVNYYSLLMTTYIQPITNTNQSLFLAARNASAFMKSCTVISATWAPSRSQRAPCEIRRAEDATGHRFWSWDEESSPGDSNCV